jgi:hypothetical protein
VAHRYDLLKMSKLQALPEGTVESRPAIYRRYFELRFFLVPEGRLNIVMRAILGVRLRAREQHFRKINKWQRQHVDHTYPTHEYTHQAIKIYQSINCATLPQVLGFQSIDYGQSS